MTVPPTTTGTPQALGPLNIDIGGAGSTPYKSIGDIAWHNIPPFAVLTGLNGSGKTQILELLAYSLIQAPHPQAININATKVTFSGDHFDPDEVAFRRASALVGSGGTTG